MSAKPIALCGFGLYATSFFLVAGNDAVGPIRGYLSALMALWIPIAPTGGDIPTRVFPMWTLGYPAMFVGGLVNIVFPVAVILQVTHGSEAALRYLRLGIPLMIACSWYTFILLRFVPREGHVLWVFGIVLALYSDEISASFNRGRRRPSEP